MPEKWEYKCQTVFSSGSSQSEEALNRLGLEGWELVGFQSQSLGIFYVLKRQSP